MKNLSIPVVIPKPTNYKQICAKVGPKLVGIPIYCDTNIESLLFLIIFLDDPNKYAMKNLVL